MHSAENFPLNIGAGDGNRTHDIQLGKHSKSKLKQEVNVKTSLQDHIFLAQVKNRLRDDVTIWSQLGKAWAETAHIHGFSVRASPVVSGVHKRELRQEVRVLCSEDLSFREYLRDLLAEFHPREPVSFETIALFEQMESDELIWADVGMSLLDAVNLTFERLGFIAADKSTSTDLKNDLLDPNLWIVVYNAWLDSGHLIPFLSKDHEEPSS